MTLEFRVLGQLEVADDGTELHLAAPKLRVLLLRLLTDVGGPVSVDAIVDALWGDTPPASAAKLVQVYVSQLRKALGAAALLTAPTGYRLAVDPAQLDAHRFTDLLSDGQRVAEAGNPALAASLFRQALALWRGPAFAEVGDEPFAAAVTARLEELRAVCLEERLGAELEAGDAEAVAAEVAGVISRYPLRERLRAVQVRALTRAGQRASALDAYREARRVLRDELGLDPGEALRDAQRLALQKEQSEPSARQERGGDHLPEPPSPLVGREQELAQLQRVLANREVRLLTLTGAGGSGKTRLALAVAKMVRHTYANGVALVELASLRDAALIPSAVATSLGIKPSRADDVLADVSDWLAERELLLVVDNAEHLPDGFEYLARLVARAPRLTVLATGRRVMHVSGEHVFPVGPLPEEAAVELFVQRARAAYPAFAHKGSEAAVAAICERLDGLPLAIELAAARAGTLTPESLLERLVSRLSVLTTGARDLPARQRTLRETLEWSANLLTPVQRSALARLSVFPAGCTLQGAETHVGTDHDTLSALVDDCLLRGVDAGGQRRFVMLETVREFADTLLGDDRAAASKALVEHCLDVVEHAELKGPKQPLGLRVIDAEQDNIRVALVLADDPETRLRLVGGMWRYWWIRGQLDEGRQRIAHALHGSSEADGGLRATALNGAAGLAWAAGDLPEARDLAEAALLQARRSGIPFAEMAAHTCLGEIAKDESDFEGCRHHHEEALAIARRNGWEMDVVVSELNLALAVVESGDLDAAEPMLTKLLAYHREHGIDEGIGFAALNLGELAYRRDDVATMQANFTEAASAFLRVGFEANAARARQGLAAAAFRTGDVERSVSLLGQAARVLSRTGEVNRGFDAIAAETEKAARRVLGDDAFIEAFDRGLSMVEH